MQPYILNVLHSSHLGVEKTKARARQSVWPGISTDIEKTIQKCEQCIMYRNKNQKEPLIQHDVPELPWTKVGSDIFTHEGKDFVVIIDYYSKFIEYEILQDKTACSIIKFLKKTFTRHGIPTEIIADNMPYGSREFTSFAKNYGISFSSSSPEYAQSNGLSEMAVKIMKRILKKCSDPDIGLLEYLNSPLTGIEYSPSQLLMNRRTRTQLPINEDLLKPVVPVGAYEQMKTNKQRQKFYYDRTAKTLPPLQPNEVARMHKNNIWQKVQVKNETAAPRSYIVQGENGRLYRRNRKHLMKSRETNFSNDPIEPPEVDEPPERMDSEQSIIPSGENLRRSTRFRRRPAYLKDYVYEMKK